MRLLIKINKQDNNITNSIIENKKGEIKMTLEKFCLDLIKKSICIFHTVGCCVYIRHRQIMQWQTERGCDLIDKRVIVVTTCCGILACFGLDILANFQEARVVAAHMVGAMTCFFGGTLYFCLQV